MFARVTPLTIGEAQAQTSRSRIQLKFLDAFLDVGTNMKKAALTLKKTQVVAIISFILKKT